MKKLNKYQNFNTNGSSLKGYVEASYSNLVDVLGQPTFTPEDSGDGKVNFEWVVQLGDDVFTVYDWKTYDAEWTMREEDIFHVGGQTDASDFIAELSNRINRNIIK